MNEIQPTFQSTGSFSGLKMPNRPKRPRDPGQLAKLIIDIASGWVEDRGSTRQKKVAKQKAASRQVAVRGKHIRSQGTVTSTDTFREVLRARLGYAQRASRAFVSINSGDLHRSIGGYPGRNHQMPSCCAAMELEMQDGDVIISRPPKGYGASLTIRYKLPR